MTKYCQLVEFHDISYRNDDQPENTCLNVVVPEETENPPVLIWIGQGAWAYTDRHKEMNVCRGISKHGIATVSVGHRLSPALISEPFVLKGVQHPAHVEDIALALKWVLQNANEFNFNENNIFIGGYSSGAHLAALLATNTRFINALRLSLNCVKGLVLVSGGYDIVEYRKDVIFQNPILNEMHIKPVFGESQDLYVDASPLCFLGNLQTPVLGIADKNMSKYLKAFESELKKVSFVKYEMLYSEILSHEELWNVLNAETNSLYRMKIIDFIKANS